MTDHRHAHGSLRRPAFGLALAVTLVYAVVELLGGLWSGSLALVSDAGHMFSDALALGLAAAAAWLAQRPVSLRHSYGWARAEVLAAMLNGLIMLSIVVFLVVEAVQRLLAPQPVAGGWVMLIAFFGLLINGLVAWMLSRNTHNINARAALIHVMGDLLGSLAALIAGAVVFATGWVLIDSLLSLLIAALILTATLRLLRDALHVLMEGVPASVDLPEIGRSLAALRGVCSVHDLHVWSITPDRLTLSAHLEVDDLTVWPQTLHAARTLLHDRFGIEHVTLQPELPEARIPETVRFWPGPARPDA